MRRLLTRSALLAVLLVALLWPAAAGAAAPSARAHDGAYVVERQQVGPRQVDLTIESPALGGASKLGFFGIGGQYPYALFGAPVAQRDIWEAHDPYYLARGLTSTRLFIASGDGTAGGPFDPPDRTDGLEAAIYRENVALADRLAALDVPAALDFYGPGTHSWPYWQRELHRALPLLLGAIDPEGG